MKKAPTIPKGTLRRRSCKERTHFGDVLWKLRQEYQLTQAELARYLGVKRNALARWESQGQFPTIDILKQIAERTSKTATDLLGF